MTKKKMKKSFHDAIDNVKDEKDLKVLLGVLENLNNTLERYDSNLKNLFDAIKLAVTVSNKGKMKDYVSDILDHYDEYTALDKQHIMEALDACRAKK